MTHEITVRPVPSLDPTSIAEAITLAKAAVASRLYAVSSPEAALMILLTGRDLGLSASQSLRAIYVVSGKPVLSADAMVAAVRRSGLCESWRVIETTVERCTIETRRRGEEHSERETFSLEDAKRAKLDAKDVWRLYPRDMLRHRCAAGLARRVYPDVILGCYVPGELDDATAVAPTFSSAPIDTAPSVEEIAETRYQQGPPAPQAPPAEGRDPRTTPQFLALVDALEKTVDCASVVGAWLDHGSTLVAAGSDVLAEGKREALAAWSAFGGSPDMQSLADAVTAARLEREKRTTADEKQRAKTRKREEAPLARGVDSPGAGEWRLRIASDTNAGHIAGGFHKRAELWRASGDIAHVRALTVDRLCEVLATDERSASAWLDGCAPGARR